MTIDELGTMVKDGFDAVDKKFDSVNGKLDNLEQDFSILKLGQESLVAKVGNLEHDVSDLRRGQDYLTAKVDSLVYRYGYDELDRRVSILETKTGIKTA
jgi:hypothetical protein